MENKDKIKLKIRALLSKTTDNGASEAEAIAALEMATKLMMQYHFTKEELADPLFGSRCFLKDTPIIKIGYNARYFYPDLARLFDCEHYYNKNRITFFGIDHDPDLCIYFYEMIMKACSREVENYKKSIEYRVQGTVFHGRTILSAFVKGFISRISEKLYDMYRQRKSCLETDNALIYMKDEKVKQEFMKLDIKIRLVRNPLKVNHADAFIDGEAQGDKIQLVKGISSYHTETRKQLTT